MANAWEPVDDIGQLQLIDETSTTQNNRLGLIIRASHATYGMGEFIYLKGVASTAIGNCVTWDSAFQTTRITTGLKGPIGFSMSANVANQFGWYQIGGIAVATAGTVASGNAVQSSSTGSTDDTATAGAYISGAIFRSADGTPSAGLALIACNRPFGNGTQT